MPRLVRCAVAALLLVILSACNNAENPSEGGRDDEPGRAGGPGRAPVVFVLGDSYTVGVTGALKERTYAVETARRLGWQIIVAGHSGTGFVNRAKIGRNYAQSFDAELAWRPAPDMVVVSGGHNDVRHTPAEVGMAADGLLTRIRAQWPQAQLVVIGPLWGSDPPARALFVRNALRNVAAAQRVPFVDPLQGRWITGNRKHGTGNAKQFILSDGTHPNPAGNRYFAARLAAELKAFGLDHPVLGRPATPAPAPETRP